MTTPDRSLEKFEQTKTFVEIQLSRYAAYHQSKEAMAYAGITLFGGIAGAAAVSNAWPPAWGEHAVVLAIIASTFLWTVVLIFLRFQLTRRRWAALRVAGCERLLAGWLQKRPAESELALAPKISKDPLCTSTFIANFIWGSKAAVRAVNTGETVYPSALVKIWLAQEQIGTDALKHERLILISGWALYLLMVGSAWFKYCYVVV